MSRYPTLALALAASLAPLAGAGAHATLDAQAAEAGKTVRLALRVPHGCDGLPTNEVRVRLPQAFVNAKPMPKPGWTLTVVRAPDAAGKSQAREIVWSGGALDDQHYDEFVFRGAVAAGTPAGTALDFPALQRCGDKTADWTGVAAPGQDPHALPNPAPRLMVQAGAPPEAHHGHGAHGGHAGHAAAPTEIRAGDLVLVGPWARATPGGARVGGGYLTITNRGTVADRLIGGTLPQAGRFEVHEMAMDGQVMRMRELKEGLEIPPGATVELKPGGYHVMFMDLKAPLTQGEKPSGTLAFQRAGTVAVTWDVRAVGARGDDHSGHHGHRP